MSRPVQVMVPLLSLALLAGCAKREPVPEPVRLVLLTRSDFFGPMAVAMMGGIVVATVITLGFLPTLYAAWFRVARPAAR